MSAPDPNFGLYARITALPLTPVAVALSCLFSLIVIVQNPLLNDDAYGYLRAAEVFNADGALAVLQSYGWYYFSILIALADRALPGGLLAAAHVIDTLLHALLTWGFIALCRELRATRRVQIFAAACILSWPLLNEMRYFVIRDGGFWALALWSLVFLIRFNRSGSRQAAIQWSITLVAASAFRIEGLLLLVLAPLFLLLPDPATPRKLRAERCGVLAGIMAVIVAVVLLLAFSAGLSLPDLIAYAWRWYLPLLANLPDTLDLIAGNVSAALFTPDNFPGSDNTTLGLAVALMGYTAVVLLNLVNALSLPLVVLLIVTRVMFGPPQLDAAAERALSAYTAVTLMALFVFLLIMHFLTQRYATFLSLLILAQAPLVLDTLYERATSRGKLREFHYWALIVLSYYLTDSLVSFGYSHRHVAEGVEWARNELPVDARLQTNSMAIAFGSGRIAEYDKVERDPGVLLRGSESGDFLVLDIAHDHNTDLIDTSPLLLPLTRFTNERGDEVRVYRRR